MGSSEEIVTSERSDEMVGVRRNIMYLVGTIWSLSFIADIVLDAYSPSPFIHMAMMSVLGALFGKEILGRNGK